MQHHELGLSALVALAALSMPALAIAQEEIDTDEIQADQEIEAEAQAKPEEPPVEEEVQPGVVTPIEPAAAPSPAPASTPVPAATPTPAPAPVLPPPYTSSAPSASSTVPPPPPSPAPAVAAKTEVEPAEEEENPDAPFNWFTVVPEVGYLLYPASDLEMQGITFTVNQRMGFVGKVHIDLGGAGLSVDLAPLIEAEGANGFKLDASEGVGGGMGGDYVGFGGELSLLYKFHVGPFFPHIGIGFHGAYLTSDALEYGSEIYGRIPLGFSVYMGKSVAFVFEFGFMYGVTGIRWKFTEAMKRELLSDIGLDEDTELPTNQEELQQFLEEHRDEIEATENPEAAQAKLMQSIASKTVSFGDGFGFDFMVGLRFP